MLLMSLGTVENSTSLMRYDFWRVKFEYCIRISNDVGTRECKVILVVVRTNERNDPASHTTADERVQSLRRRCGIGNSTTFVLPLATLNSSISGQTISFISIHPFSFIFLIAKLTKTIHSSSVSYYLGFARKLKKWEKLLSSNTIAPSSSSSTGSIPSFDVLKVRYNFKVGYLYEFQRNNEKALRHYKSAYGTLLTFDPNTWHDDAEDGEERKGGTKGEGEGENEMYWGEKGGMIRDVGEILHIRICRLILAQIAARKLDIMEIFSHFWAHVSHFSKCTGFSEVEQLGWMENQYLTFAQMLNAYTKSLGDNLNNCLGCLGGIWSFYYSASLYSIQRFQVLYKDDPNVFWTHFTCINPMLWGEEAKKEFLERETDVLRYSSYRFSTIQREIDSIQNKEEEDQNQKIDESDVEISSPRYFGVRKKVSISKDDGRMDYMYIDEWEEKNKNNLSVVASLLKSALLRTKNKRIEAILNLIWAQQLIHHTSFEKSLNLLISVSDILSKDSQRWTFPLLLTLCSMVKVGTILMKEDLVIDSLLKILAVLNEVDQMRDLPPHFTDFSHGFHAYPPLPTQFLEKSYVQRVLLTRLRSPALFKSASLNPQLLQWIEGNQALKGSLPHASSICYHLNDYIYPTMLCDKKLFEVSVSFEKRFGVYGEDVQVEVSIQSLLQLPLPLFGIQAHFHPEGILDPLFLTPQMNQHFNDVTKEENEAGERRSGLLFEGGSTPFISQENCEQFSFPIRIEEKYRRSDLHVTISHFHFYLITKQLDTKNGSLEDVNLQAEKEEEEEDESEVVTIPDSFEIETYFRVNAPIFEHLVVIEHQDLSLKKICRDPSSYLTLHPHSPHLTISYPPDIPSFTQYSLHRLDLHFQSNQDEIIDGRVNLTVDPYSNSSQPDSLFFWWKDSSSMGEETLFRPFPIPPDDTQPGTVLLLKYIPPNSDFHFPLYVRSLKQGNHQITLKVEYIPSNTISTPVSVIFSFKVNFSKPFTIASSTSTTMDWTGGVKREGKHHFVLDGSNYHQNFTIDNLHPQPLIIEEISVHEMVTSTSLPTTFELKERIISSPLDLFVRERYSFPLKRRGELEENNMSVSTSLTSPTSSKNQEGVKILWRRSDDEVYLEDEEMREGIMEFVEGLDPHVDEKTDEVHPLLEPSAAIQSTQTTIIPVTSPQVFPAPFDVSTSFPEHCIIGDTYLIELSITNCLPTQESISIFVEETKIGSSTPIPQCFVSGDMKKNVVLPSQSTIYLSWVVLPLFEGEMVSPHIRLLWNKTKSPVIEVGTYKSPRHIEVFPSDHPMN